MYGFFSLFIFFFENHRISQVINVNDDDVEEE